jgi:hypothetical protein
MRHTPGVTPVRTAGRLTLALALLLVASSLAKAMDPEPLPSGTITEKVRPGDSWTTIRNRMFPLGALQEINPKLDPRMLHPDEVVRSPYVPASALLKERRAREDAEARLSEVKARLDGIERQSGMLQALRHDLDRARGRRTSLRMLTIALLVLLAAMAVILAVALQATRLVRRHLREEQARYQALETRYTNLRRSLQEIDVGLQRRMVDLLRLHGGKIVDEKEIGNTIKPILSFTSDLKKKHAS